MPRTEPTWGRDSSTVSSNENSGSKPESGHAESGHTTRYAKVYHFFGFDRAYNFPLWVIFAGGMLGFSLSRLKDLDYSHIFKNEFALIAGYWYYFSQGSIRIGMIIHLAAVLPACILVVLQFTPAIRHKFITFHRVNGYIVILLFLLSNAAACVVLRHNQGGGARIAAQTSEAFLVIITTVGIAAACYNIRKKQIDQHRAWMLRTMFYMGTIITSRILNEVAVPIVSRMGSYYGTWKCDEINLLYKELGSPFPEAAYSQCLLPNGNVDLTRHVAVSAARLETEPERYGANLVLPFGANLWICIAVHIIGVELYLSLTPKEAERLRRVSYERQVEAGFANPGSAGLTSDRWGDAEKWSLGH